MIFNKGMVIRHKKWLDVAYLVRDAMVEFGRYEVHGQWINMGYERTYPITPANLTQVIKIHGDTIDNGDWYACVDPEAKCVRNEKWFRL